MTQCSILTKHVKVKKLVTPLSCYRYPVLAKMARQYLSIPATEVASERMFSAAGLTLTKLRSLLDADTVDVILFLHKNYVPKVSDY